MLSSQQLLGGQYSWSKVLVRWLNTLGNPPHPTPVSDHFCNFLKQTIQHSYPPYHMIDQLYGGENMKLGLSQALHYLRTYFGHYSFKQPMQHSRCFPGETVWKCGPLSPFFFTNMSSLLDYQLFIPPSSVAVWSTYKTVAFVAWSDNTLYEPLLLL